MARVRAPGRPLTFGRSCCLIPSQGDQQPDADGITRAPGPGQPGFRWHAAIPQAASLDYVRAPASQFAMPEKKQGGGKDKGGFFRMHLCCGGVGMHAYFARLEDVGSPGWRMKVRPPAFPSGRGEVRTPHIQLPPFPARATAS